MNNFLRATFFLLLCAAGAPAAAAPRLPASDAEILERLPWRPRDPRATELRALRAAANAAPRDPAAVAPLARRYFALAVAEGDPRYVGYAQAVLSPWWGNADAPADLMVLRALVRQYRHDFDGALADLARAARIDPQNADAHAWTAAIQMVRADYAAARRACMALEALGDTLRAAGCLAYVEATTGGARGAHARLSAALARAPDAGPNERLWLQTRLAEMAWRLDEPERAERHFRAALSLGVEDNFLLAAYADFLLDRGREREVVALLRDRTRSDTLLLRLAIAQARLGAPQAAAHAQALGERFAEAAARGERLHLQEEARYLLELRQDPAAALAAATENWKTQREPRDARILLEAARAARQPAAAAPALAWLRESGFEDPRLARIAAELR